MWLRVLLYVDRNNNRKIAAPCPCVWECSLVLVVVTCDCLFVHLIAFLGNELGALQLVQNTVVRL